MATNETRISGLDTLLKAADGDKLPPVEKWDPEHCGEIGMEIRADGTWFYQGSPIGRQKLVKLFSRILRREADGSHVLVTPVEKVAIDVADAPFRAVEMEVRSAGGRDQSLIFRTNVDDVVTVGRDHGLSFRTEERSEGLKPYVEVRRGLEALVSRALYYDLVALAEPLDDETDAMLSATGKTYGADVVGVWSCGLWWPLLDATGTADGC
ncbi:MAG: DUF1285 domain-containing protein [Pseudomonadota bacterium]